jgi:electron transport complex protein RnfG
MKRLESNLLNMVLSLTMVTLGAAALLGGLYVMTAEPIQQQKAEKQQAAISAVLPAIEGLEIAPAEEKDGNTIYKAYKDGEWVATAVQTEETGFGGKFRLMVGFDKEGNVVNYEVLEHQETPGLGDHMTTWFKTDKNRQSVVGKNPVTTHFFVSKDEGGEVDAITAATISSRAFLKAVRNAYNSCESDQTQAVSGATTLLPEENTGEPVITEEPQNAEDHE